MELSLASVSPDGSQIAFVKHSDRSAIWAAGPLGEDPHLLLSLPNNNVFSLAWSADAHRIAYLREKGDLNAAEEVVLESCDRTGDQRREILNSKSLVGSYGPTDIVWSREGRLFYQLSEPAPNVTFSNLWVIEVDPASGGVISAGSRLTSDTGVVQRSLTGSADGKRLTFLRTRVEDVTQFAPILSRGAQLGPPQPWLAITGPNGWKAGRRTATPFSIAPTPRANEAFSLKTSLRDRRKL
jgi:hypothetical protein